MLTDDDITSIAQTVEQVLERYGIPLTVGRFNALCDYVTELVRAVEEDGE